MAPPCPTTHKLLDRIEDLRVFPEVGARVLAVAHSPRTTLSDMERAVSADPVLAGKVVELSNSALYLRGRPHDELRRAIQVLGFAATRDTALALALASIGDPADASTAYLWRHATAAARVAQALAPFVPVAVARSAHLCALVHDIGRQLMAVVHPGALDEVLSRPLAVPAPPARRFSMAIPAVVLAAAASLVLALVPSVGGRSMGSFFPDFGLSSTEVEDVIRGAEILGDDDLSAAQWGDRRDRLFGLWKDDSVSDEEARFRLLAQIGRSASLAGEIRAPYFVQQDGGMVNHFLAEAAAMNEASG